jgi:DNA polymerase (family 10)
VFEAAAEQDVMMEINAFPTRLDLNDVNSRAAYFQAVDIAIGTDAHTVDQLKYLPLGIAVARRGWLSSEAVVNTLNLNDLLKRVDR